MTAPKQQIEWLTRLWQIELAEAYYSQVVIRNAQNDEFLEKDKADAVLSDVPPQNGQS